MEKNKQDILDMLRPDRLRVLTETKDPYYVYKILSKHYELPVEVLMTKFEVILEVHRYRMEVKGSESEIFTLFNLLTTKGVKIDSITETVLRFGTSTFIQNVY